MKPITTTCIVSTVQWRVLRIDQMVASITCFNWNIHTRMKPIPTTCTVSTVQWRVLRIHQMVALTRPPYLVPFLVKRASMGPLNLNSCIKQPRISLLKCKRNTKQDVPSSSRCYEIEQPEMHCSEDSPKPSGTQE